MWKPINWHRVHAVITRHLMSWPRSLERLADAFWWPTINLSIWGLVTIFLQKQSGSTEFFVNIFLGGVMMWVVVSRAQEEMGIAFLQEAWDRNLLNMFTSPLTIWEFSIATILLATFKLILSFSWMCLLAYVLFAFNIFTFGWILLPYALLLMVSGWSLGLIINGFILQHGYRVQVFAWTLILLFQPFSGVYYPVSAMPPWMQIVAKGVPMSYIFEGMRTVMTTGRVDMQGLIIAAVLNVIYIAIGIWFFSYSFKKAQETGMIMKFS
jgi:ABC-2 type transport system permease protein